MKRLGWFALPQVMYFFLFNFSTHLNVLVNLNIIYHFQKNITPTQGIITARIKDFKIRDEETRPRSVSSLLYVPFLTSQRCFQRGMKRKH